MSSDLLVNIRLEDLNDLAWLIRARDAYKKAHPRSRPMTEKSFAFVRDWLAQERFGEDAVPEGLAEVMAAIHNLYNGYPETCRRLLKAELRAIEGPADA